MNPTTEIRILLVDDHAIVREGLRALLDGKPGLRVVGEAANGVEAVHQSALLLPDVVLMDLVMPVMDGITAIREIKAAQPSARILVLTSFADDEQVFAALRCGALGYLLKDSSPAELVEAIRSVYDGQPSLTPSVARKLLVGGSAPVQAGNPQQPIPALSSVPLPIEPLTERELDVLRLIARGMSNAEIAAQIVVGEGTVRFHVSNILAKLQLDNRTQAVLYALRAGLAKLE